MAGKPGRENFVANSNFRGVVEFPFSTFDFSFVIVGKLPANDNGKMQTGKWKIPISLRMGQTPITCEVRRSG